MQKKEDLVSNDVIIEISGEIISGLMKALHIDTSANGVHVTIKLPLLMFTNYFRSIKINLKKKKK